jgi:hypothetical protein
MIGTLNIEITFADSIRKLRFEPHDDGRGTFLPVDPAANFCGRRQTFRSKMNLR